MDKHHVLCDKTLFFMPFVFFNKFQFQVVTLGWGIMSKLSCISILEEENVSSSPLPLSIVIIIEDITQGQNPFGIEVLKICLVGTHKPSIMLMLIIHGRNFTRVMNYMGTIHSGCVPNNINDALPTP